MSKTALTPQKGRTLTQAGIMQYWIRCSNCKGIGNIDKDQYEGKVSIICTNCQHHWTEPHA